MSADAIQITFLPKGITVHELRSVLLEKISEVFEPHTGSIVVKIYEDGKATSAVVTGFNYNFEVLRMKFRRVEFVSSATRRRCSNVNVKLDTGEERNPDGSFMEERSPSFKRNFQKLGGVTPRKLLLFFNDQFLRDVKPIFSGFHIVLYIPNLLPNQIFLEEIKKLGYICTFKPYQNNSGTMVSYGSELETLQAIALLNNNTRYSMGVIKFKNLNSNRLLDCTYKKGLGNDGNCLEIEKLFMDHGYIPISAFDKSILNEKLPSLQTLSCRRCKGPYEILGISPFLNSLASRCLCSYERNQNSGVMVAVFWPGENFTRLIQATNELSTSIKRQDFCVQYNPVKRCYTGTEEYLDVHLPLMYEEWKTISTTFKSENKTSGKVVSIFLVDGGNEKQKKKVYAMKISIPRSTNVWAAGNPSCIKKLTLVHSEAKFNRVVNKWKKAKVFKMNADGNSVMLITQLTLNAQNPPELNTWIEIIPKPNKCEYNGTKAALKKWNKNISSTDSPLTKVMLNPLQGLEHWALPDEAVNTRRHYYLIRNGIENWKNEICNSQQVEAINNAIYKNVSFIHGPPGCGKTFVLSVLINLLWHREKGAIIVTAPSNFAADGLAHAVLKNVPPGFPAPRILRIFADSKEEYPSSNLRKWDFPTLDSEVQKSDSWLSPSACAGFYKYARKNQLVLLSEDQFQAYKEHKRHEEKMTMDNYDVFVLTVGALADKRVEGWALNHPVSTLILDEAGQLLHSATINLFGVHAKRYVFAGDPEQLSPHINSQTAEYAGSNLSLMEMVYLCGVLPERQYSYPPWTTLIVQHRMHKNIRKMVSEITYNNKLVDANEEVGQADEFTTYLQNKFPKRVVFLNNTNKEESVGTSFLNEEEANVIVNHVTDFVTGGVMEQLIVILTLYDAQKELILKLLKQKALDVQVLNVDAYQGREAPIVLLSFTRSNDTGDIGFAATSNRINVGISRAQQFLFMAGNLGFLEKLKYQHWKRFCRIIRRERYDEP